MDLRNKIATIRGSFDDCSAGCGWLLLGTVQLMILSLVHHDPIQKKLTKLENSEREVCQVLCLNFTSNFFLP